MLRVTFYDRVTFLRSSRPFHADTTTECDCPVYVGGFGGAHGRTLLAAPAGMVWIPEGPDEALTTAVKAATERWEATANSDWGCGASRSILLTSTILPASGDWRGPCSTRWCDLDAVT